MAKGLSVLRIRYQFTILILFFLMMTPDLLWAWGSRGHSLICEASIHLVKNPDLKNYLMSKIEAVTYLCNLPDTHWRSLQRERAGSSSHFFEVDNIGLEFKNIPADFKEFEKLAKGRIDQNKQRAISAPSADLGSSWWRAEQFHRLAINKGKAATKNQEGKKDFEPELHQMFALMGLLGHFVGDNSQPLHNTSNYDGWYNGHGGLHSYYETDIVNQLDPSILANIVDEAKTKTTELHLEQKDSPVEKMRRLSILSFGEIKTLWSMDPLIKASELKTEKGMELKTEAVRKAPEKVAPQFKSLIVSEMARSAALLAYLWDEIYQEAGAPSFAKDRSYYFPHQFEYVPLDYISQD